MRFNAADGTEIAVGKNALQNERLTLSARGEDIWLHAKDMPGSHVIIRAEGREVSDDTLLTAARLAAFYSKARGVAVPVDYTLRKFVKKPSGAPGRFRQLHQAENADHHSLRSGNTKNKPNQIARRLPSRGQMM
ncbi:MAG: NFACT RNA binding domain-containing protein [Christensenellales bacterium]